MPGKLSGLSTVALTSVLAGVVGGASVATLDEGKRTCAGIGLPAYFRPGPAWDRALAAGPALRFMILNLANGPGTTSDPAFVTAVRDAQAQSVAVLGYVDTSYGKRAPNLAEGDIDRFKEWYGVDGILFDQVSSSPGDLRYYRVLSDYVRASLGRLVVLNPGTFPDEGYMDVGDVVVTFEGFFGVYRDLYSPGPDWVSSYAPERFWHLVYSTLETDLPAALTLARSRGAATVYVTDGTLPNPWGALPSYWERESALVAESNPADCQEDNVS